MLPCNIYTIMYRNTYVCYVPQKLQVQVTVYGDIYHAKSYLCTHIVWLPLKSMSPCQSIVQITSVLEYARKLC